MTLLNTYSSPACPKLKVYVFRVVVAGRYLGVDSTDLWELVKASVWRYLQLSTRPTSVSPLTKPCVLAYGPVTFARLWRRCQLSGVSNGQASELNVLLFRHSARNGAFRQVRQCHQRRRTERFTFSVMCTHRTSQTSMCR